MQTYFQLSLGSAKNSIFGNDISFLNTRKSNQQQKFFEIDFMIKTDTIKEWHCYWSVVIFKSGGWLGGWAREEAGFEPRINLQKEIIIYCSTVCVTLKHADMSQSWIKNFGHFYFVAKWNTVSPCTCIKGAIANAMLCHTLLHKY